MSSIVGVNPSNALQNCETTAAGHLKVDLASSGGGALSANVDITGNSIGIATSANQSTANSSLSTIASNSTSLAATVSGNELQVDVITSALPSGAATESTLSTALGELQTMDASLSSIQSNVATSALQSAGNSSLATIAGAVSGSEVQVDVITSALPSGAATESTLSNAEAHLGTIDTSTATASTTLTGISAKLPAALGQDVMNDSLSVVIASNQSSIPVSSAGANVSATSESASPTAGTTTNSTAADMNGFQHVAIFGTTSNTTDQFKVQFSNDNSAFFTNQTAYVGLTSGGNFAVNIENVAARYVRVSQGNTTGSGQTLTIITSKK